MISKFLNSRVKQWEKNVWLGSAAATRERKRCVTTPIAAAKKTRCSFPLVYGLRAVSPTHRCLHPLHLISYVTRKASHNPFAYCYTVFFITVLLPKEVSTIEVLSSNSFKFTLIPGVWFLKLGPRCCQYNYNARISSFLVLRFSLLLFFLSPRFLFSILFSGTLVSFLPVSKQVSYHKLKGRTWQPHIGTSFRSLNIAFASPCCSHAPLHYSMITLDYSLKVLLGLHGSEKKTVKRQHESKRKAVHWETTYAVLNCKRPHPDAINIFRLSLGRILWPLGCGLF